MKLTKWFVHPVIIFVFSIIALGLSLFLYIYWYVEVSSRLQTLIGRFDLDRGQFFQLETWVVIVILSILVGLILVGIFIIFVYNLKIRQLYQLQHNFINNFTHELKTPVTSIKLYLDTFQKYELDRDKQLKYIDYMLSDVSRLTANINRILSLARIESGSYKGEFERLDLIKVVQGFVDNHKHLFGNCQLHIVNPSGLPMPQPVDQALFEMLLMNLLTNAIKYNDAKQVEITISFERLDKSLRIGFKDNGIGMKQREFKKVFKKFYQIKKDGSPQAGSGLGLYLVDRIARIHKGKIQVASAGPGMGTTFTLILPTAKLLTGSHE